MTGIPDDWYETQNLGGGLTLIRERYVAKWLRCNIWHMRGRDRDILIDSGMGLRSLKREIPRLSERNLTAISSHCHFDHIGCSHEFTTRLGHRSEAPVLASPDLDNTCA